MAIKKNGTVLLTGFPGFIGKRLLVALAARHARKNFVLIVQERLVDRAEALLSALAEEVSGFAGRWEIAVGDITARRLGMSEETHADLLERVNEVWHLAAIYDLSVEEHLAYRVNVVGTINVLDFCEACQSFERFMYVSTCFVSGSRDGLVREVELDEGQGFKNHYESTKFWAEVEVQRRMETIPTVIFRPGIVVGDSRTGETAKYDGPYYLMRFIMKMPERVPMLNVGSGKNLVNIVPVDFVIDAMVEIAGQEGATNEVYHLADPNPMRAGDLVELIMETMGKAPPIGSLPPFIINTALRLSSVQSLVEIPHEAVVYFNHGARYGTDNMLTALEDTEVRCPHISSYLDTIVHYLERNPDRPR